MDYSTGAALGVIVALVMNVGIEYGLFAIFVFVGRPFGPLWERAFTLLRGSLCTCKTRKRAKGF